MKNQCLGCYLPLEEDIRYHKSCSKKLFGTDEMPNVDFGTEDLEELAKKSINNHLALTGVQQKISVNLDKHKNSPDHRLMMVDLWGQYILKPATQTYPEMPLVEDATMHLAELAGITTAHHGLIKLKSGELAYVTKRFDREKKHKKMAMEDFCQLSEMLTSDKYETSTEKAGKVIWKYSANPGLDIVKFLDIIVFSFLTGNADMHLKNFSLLQNANGEMVLAPAYDLLSTKLLLPEDKEDVALTINGKKTKIKKNDFLILAENLKINKKAVENSFERILKAIPNMKDLIRISFMSENYKTDYLKLLETRGQLLT